MIRAKKFARLLTEGIHRIRLREAKTVQIIQDELGYELGRQGGSAIQYWRKGHVPADAADVARLARLMVRRGRLEPRWLDDFLSSADYDGADQLRQELFPEMGAGETAVVPDAPLPPEPAPFVVGPPVLHPRQFFGRERALKRIFGLLSRFPLQNVAIIGPYRSGKTSLLHMLQTVPRTPAAELRADQQRDWLPQPQRYNWVFVDFQDVRMQRRQDLLQYLLREMGLTVPSTCDLTTFLTIVSGELARPTVVLMDEIGAALASPQLDQEFWWSLRSLGSNQTRGLLAFILTSQALPAQVANAHGKPSPFFNIFGHTLRLGPFTEAAARALLAGSPIPFAADDVAWMLAESGRWPFLLQMVAHVRLLALEEGETGDGWRAEARQQLAPFAHLRQEASG